MPAMKEDFRVGDPVMWKEYDDDVGEIVPYSGVIAEELSSQYLVYTTRGTERFVLKNDRTLVRYKGER